MTREGALLSVLLVEDVEDDADLLLREITRGGFFVEHRRVQTADDMRKALAERPWQLILSDWSMPGFSGTGALRVLHESGLDVPFIVLSGTVGEEVAVEALKAGAHDFVPKERLTRLVPAIHRELRDAVARRERRKAEIAAEEALRDKLVADAANRAKSAFVAAMSHEIRTPMNAILGYTQLLRRLPDLTAQHRSYIDIVHRSGEHLLEVINDVLELAKIEVGQRELRPVAFELSGLLEELDAMFRVRTDEKGIRFETRRSGALPARVVADAGKLRQILVNLLGNAVKFTSAGAVVLHVSTEETQAGARLVVAVEDTGPGIDAGELAGLFQPFLQTSVGRAAGGTGLGLTISRDLARLMGGDVTVESTLGAGTVFRVAIPVEASAGPLASRPSAMARLSEGAAPRILVVDDDETSRVWLCALLQGVGFEVQQASSAGDAVSTFDRWQPSLVFVDLELPDVAAMQARPGAGATPIVALTARTFDDAEARASAAGARGLLRKPCREAEILAEIRAHLGVAYVELSPSPGSPTPAR